MLLRQFLRDRRAGIAPMFALAIVPIIGFVGAAVDYSRASTVRTNMQAAADATSLAMSKVAPSLTPDQLTTQARAYFNSIFKTAYAKTFEATPIYTNLGANGSELRIDVTGTVDNQFMGFLGFGTMTVGTSSIVKWGSQRLRVALVLDTTGSMGNSGKISAMQTATKNLLDQLKASETTTGDVYVSIIPFSKDVNVGSTSSTWSATWLQFDDGTDKSWDGANGTCSKSGYSPRSQCQAQNACSLSQYTTQTDCTSNGTCSLTQYTSQLACTSAGTCSNPGETTQSGCTGNRACSNAGYTTRGSCQAAGYAWGYGTWTATPGTWTAGVWAPAVWTPNNHSSWNGCVTDRGSATAPGTSAGNDQKVTAPTTSDPTTLFYPEQYAYCSPTMQGLSNQWTTMKTLVDNLYPAGSTNQPIGLVSGWQSLVGIGPFTAPPLDANYVYKQVIILLSDGLNTQDRWYGNGSDPSTSVDRRMLYPTSASGAGTCKNIKDAGITIYAIQVNTGGDPQSSLLEYCASPGKFVMLTTANQIIDTFQQIGTQLSQLRIAK